MANSPFEDMSFGVQEQATSISYGDYNPLPFPNMMAPVGSLNLTADPLWEELITPQTESVQPMDYSGPQDGIEYETGTEGSQFAPGMERHAPTVLSLQGNVPYLPSMSMQPSYHMPTLYGNDSVSVEMSGSPRASDKFYPAVTPMTPCEERGTYCPSPALSYQPPSVASVISEASSVSEDTVIEKNVPNEKCYGLAVWHANTLSDPEEGALLIHGRLAQKKYPSILLPEAKIAKPEVQTDKTRSERVTVQYKLPSYYQSMEEYIQKSSLEEDGGYYCMESVMRVVRKLEHLHSKLLSGHGAISDISNIQMHVSRRSRDLVTMLIPELSKLAEAMKLRDVVPDEYLVSRGMLEDIKSLGTLLRSLLPLLKTRDIHVSQKLLGSLEKAADLCFEATSRGDMAKIAQALNFKKRLCTLHVKFPPNSGMCTLDIVCYEGENIYEVLKSAWLDGATVEMYGFKLCYDDSKLPVVKDNEVFFPVCKVHLAPKVHY